MASPKISTTHSGDRCNDSNHDFVSGPLRVLSWIAHGFLDSAVVRNQR